MSDATHHADVAIFGGGVAGLWLLARLRSLGYQAVLFEAQALGAGQTRHAQGIIHGGTKYALTGKLTGSSESIAEMPGLWRAALAGEGEVDLRGARLLSNHQFMWSTESLTSRMAGFFASRVMQSRTATVVGEARPQVLRDRHFKGHVYRLEEPVLDVASLVQALAEPYRDAIFRLPPLAQCHFQKTADGWQIDLAEGAQPLQLQVRRLILTAGKGNAALLQQLGRETPAMQLRPLQMVMVRKPKAAPLPGTLYAHCLGASANPRITITTHYDAVGNTVWYLGGQIAEEGVGRNRDAQIAAARRELNELFPWLDLAAAQWGVLPIERAEVRMADGSRPDNAFFSAHDGVFTAWPTKLALAPRLARLIIEALQGEHVTPGAATPLPQWPHPGYALLPWQEEERWS